MKALKSTIYDKDKNWELTRKKFSPDSQLTFIDKASDLIAKVERANFKIKEKSRQP